MNAEKERSYPSFCAPCVAILIAGTPDALSCAVVTIENNGSMNNEVSKIDFFIHVVFKMNAAKIRIFSEEVKLKEKKHFL